MAAQEARAPDEAKASPSVVRHPAVDAPCLAYLYASPLVHRQFGEKAPMDVLDTSAERGILREALLESNRAIALRNEVATSDNLRMLVTLGCRALHYSGHGMPRCLAFENGRGEMHPLEVSMMKKLFSAGGGAEGVRFVFVSACHSESAGAAFVEAGVPHVVAVRKDARVSDESSKIFAKNFYLALLCSRTVRQAFDIGQASVEAAPGAQRRGDASGAKFMLLPLGADHDVPVFGDAAPGRFLDETRRAPRNTCDTAVARLAGRNVEMQETFMFLANGCRCVTVRGVAGVGKTALATKACHYISERNVFDNICFLPLGGAGAAAGFSTAEGGGGGSLHPVCAAIAKAVGGAAHGARSESELFEALQRGGERTLLVLDGVADGRERCAEWVRALSALLRRTTHTSLLLTQRHVQAKDAEDTQGGDDGAKGQGDDDDDDDDDLIIGEGEKVRLLHGLDTLSAAQLFIQKCPRNLTLQEMGATGQLDALQSLARSPLLAALEGHPAALSRVAQQLDQHESLQAMEKALLPKVKAIVERARSGKGSKEGGGASPASAGLGGVGPGASPGADEWEKAEAKEQELQKAEAKDTEEAKGSLAGRDGYEFVVQQELDQRTGSSVDDRAGCALWMSLAWGATGEQPTIEWARLGDALRNFFCSRLPATVGPRPLGADDLAFCRAVYPKLIHPSPWDGRAVTVKGFAKFWGWFSRLMVTLAKLQELWCQVSPMLLHGFVDRVQAEGMLSSCCSGTFLVRFASREQHAGWLAVSFKDVRCENENNKGTRPASIEHCLIRVDADGFVIFFRDSGMKYPTLHELVQQCNKFKYLWPDVPKETAFLIGR